MIRVNLVLLLAVLASALYLVNVQYESRRLFSELDRARSEARKLSADKERLQVENRAQATPLRVEMLAKSKLQMRTATPAITHYVTYRAPTRLGDSGETSTATLAFSGVAGGRP